MLRFQGAEHFRQRLVCATLGAKAIRIDDIRAQDQNPGLRDYEASLLRLLEKVTNGCIIEINETGARRGGGQAAAESGPWGQPIGALGALRAVLPARDQALLLCTCPPPCRHQPALQAGLHPRGGGAGARLRHQPRHRLLPGAAGLPGHLWQEGAGCWLCECVPGLPFAVSLTASVLALLASARQQLVQAPAVVLRCAVS